MYQKHQRDGFSLDFLVLLLGMILLLSWLLGSIYLAYFPANKSYSADKQQQSSLLGAKSDSGNGENSTGSDETDLHQPAAENGDVSNDGSGNRGVATSDSQFTAVNQAFDSRLSELQKQFDARMQKIELGASQFKAPAQATTQDVSSEQLESLSDTVAKQTRTTEELRLDLFRKQTALDQLQKKLAQLSDRVAAAEKRDTEVLRVDDNTLTLDATTNVQDDNNPANSSLVFRNWTGHNGKVIEMAFVKFRGTQVEFIDKNRNRFYCEINQLSEQDQAFLRALQNQ